MKWRPVDIIVATLTLVIVMVIVGTAMSAGLSGHPLPDARAKIVAGIVSSIISIVSLYVGAALQRHKDNKDDDRLD